MKRQVCAAREKRENKIICIMLIVILLGLFGINILHHHHKLEIILLIIILIVGAMGFLYSTFKLYVKPTPFLHQTSKEDK